MHKFLTIGSFVVFASPAAAERLPHLTDARTSGAVAPGFFLVPANDIRKWEQQHSKTAIARHETPQIAGTGQDNMDGVVPERGRDPSH